MRRLSGSAIKQLLQQRDGFRLAIILEVDFGELQEQRPRLAHHPLLDVQIGQFLERANLFGREFGDALVNGDGFGQETVADEELRQALEIVDGLKGLALADVQLADGHQGDLIARLVLQNLLVFGDGLGDLALVEELLRGFDEFAFVIGHSGTQTMRSLACWWMRFRVHTAKAG